MHRLLFCCFVVFALWSGRCFGIDALDVIYIPGYQNKNRPQDKQLKILQFVGHSLGGRIVVRTLAQLARKKAKIRYGVILGAAIPYNDPEIALALQASDVPNIIIYNHHDDILRELYPQGEKRANGAEYYHCALGCAGYCAPYSPDKLIQFRCDDNSENFKDSVDFTTFSQHKAELYLLCLQSAIKGKRADDPPMHDIKDIPHESDSRNKITPNQWTHENIFEKFGWRLMRVRLTNKRVIVDPMNYQRAHGSEQEMQESWNYVSQQLDMMISR